MYVGGAFLSVIAVDARARGGGNVSVVSGVGPREDSDVVGVAGGWGGGGGGGVRELRGAGLSVWDCGDG